MNNPAFGDSAGSSASAGMASGTEDSSETQNSSSSDAMTGTDSSTTGPTTSSGTDVTTMMTIGTGTMGSISETETADGTESTDGTEVDTDETETGDTEELCNSFSMPLFKMEFFENDGEYVTSCAMPAQSGFGTISEYSEENKTVKFLGCTNKSDCLSQMQCSGTAWAVHFTMPANDFPAYFPKLGMGECIHYGIEGHRPTDDPGVCRGSSLAIRKVVNSNVEQLAFVAVRGQIVTPSQVDQELTVSHDIEDPCTCSGECCADLIQDPGTYKLNFSGSAISSNFMLSVGEENSGFTLSGVPSVAKNYSSRLFGECGDSAGFTWAMSWAP